MTLEELTRLREVMAEWRDILQVYAGEIKDSDQWQAIRELVMIAHIMEFIDDLIVKAIANRQTGSQNESD